MKSVKLCLFGTLFFFSQLLFSESDGATRPQFPGGDKALMQFLNNNIRYPEEAQKQKWQGNTLVAFSVNEDGTIANPRVLKSSWLVLDNEALRVIKMMPKWVPASQNGVSKKEMVVLPIVFDLNKKNIQY